MHTPYDGSSKLFDIGLRPLDLHDWIDTDHKLLSYLDEKDRIAARAPEQYFMAEAGTEAAQSEVLHLLADHLPERYPDIYQRLGPVIEIAPAFRRAQLDALFVPPLLIAAGLVQEDLVLMRKGDTGWRLSAAALAFPSAWDLCQKFGRPMAEIHAPIPGFGPNSRHANLIERIFDNLRPEQPVVRWNWSFYGDDRLFHPHSHAPDRPRFGEGERADKVFLRLERQTVRKLPVSGDILFTIRIYIDPLEAIERRADASELAKALSAQLQAMTPEQLDYKGLTLESDRLLKRLATIA
ncbi:MAG: DUF3445 domain-containing protein [Asticcacaulis sp.]